MVPREQYVKMVKVPHNRKKAKLWTGKTDIMMTGDEIITEGKEDGVCGMYGGKEECIQSFGGETTWKT